MSFKRIIIYQEPKIFFNLPETYPTNSEGEFNSLLSFILKTYLEEGYKVLKEAPTIDSLEEIITKIRQRLSDSITTASKDCNNYTVLTQFDRLEFSRDIMKELTKLKDYRKGTLDCYNEMLRDIEKGRDSW